MKKLIERIKEKTPEKEARKRNIAGAIGTACGIILAAGLVTNPVGIVALSIGAAIFGGKSLYHAQKTESDENRTDSNG